MDADRLAALTRINQVDNGVPFVATPGPGETEDWWTDEPVPGRSWVCRDYTQMKANHVRALGWEPPPVLSVILCWVETGEYHAVLGVEVDGERWVLDSRFPAPYRFDAPPAGYRWDREQVAGTTGFVTSS